MSDNGLALIEARVLQNLESSLSTFWDESCSASLELRDQFAADGRGECANKAWFLAKVCELRRRYVQSVREARNQEYYKAWCGFEVVEIGLSSLVRNLFYDPKIFQVEGLLAQTTDWQALYPYKVFFSPGILERRKECSICRAVSDPWSNCGHDVGKVYNGEECYLIVTQAEFLEISLVLDPVQKYSVVHKKKNEAGELEDIHDYGLVRFVAERIQEPFDRWTIEWTKARHPHNLFAHVASSAQCPCESEKTYADCCSPEEGVLRPHAVIVFDREPPAGLPTAAFAGYR